LLDELLFRRSHDKKPTLALFIDFSSAYDRVDRRILERLLQERRVLNDTEIQLWKFLASNQRILVGGSKTSCTSGVPQGSTISPMLFDIYTEPLL
jgi:hypothetical protein